MHGSSGLGSGMGSGGGGCWLEWVMTYKVKGRGHSC